MFRTLLITTTLVATTVEPVMAGDADYVKYGITQGGLLCVVLVLLWYVKQMHQRELAEKDERLAEKDERLDVVTTLVANNTAAMVKNADAIGSQAKSIEGLARAVEKIEERRAQR